MHQNKMWMLLSKHAITCWSSQWWWCPWQGLAGLDDIYCSTHFMQCSPYHLFAKITPFHTKNSAVQSKVHLHSFFQEFMSCLQVFCKTLVGHLCLWYIFLWVSSSLSSLSIWLPLAGCGGSILLKLSYILFILYWINFTLAPPGIPSASPLSSPDSDSSFLLEIMSIICLYLAWVLQELQ